MNDTAAIQNVVRKSLQLFLALLTLSAAVTFVFPDIIAGKIIGDIRTKASMLLFIPCLFFTGFENIYKSFFYGVKLVRPNIISEISELSIRIMAIFTLLYINKSSLTPEKTAYLIVLGMIISEIFSFTFLGLYYKKYNATNKLSVGATLAVAPIKQTTNIKSDLRATARVAPTKFNFLPLPLFPSNTQSHLQF